MLAATKLEVPRVPAGLVQRGRLVEALTAASAAKLMLISAPAGSGKTTLLGEWHAAAAEERRFAWLSLDPSDNDPVRFFEGVIAALRGLVPGVGGQALAALAGPTSLTDVVLPSLINDLADFSGRLVLVLDDYHLITNPRIHESLDYLLEHLPQALQLSLATRSEPPLALGRLRVRRELVEVHATQLRFTDGEATTLLNEVLGLGLDRDDIDRLQGRTEGWAAGLQLAALSLSGRDDAHGFISSFAGDDRPIVDYLGFEVLDGQSSEVRSFLLRTSLLDRLSGGLCDAVLDEEEEEDSAARLEELERANLFLVPLDDKRQWYRYHHLFAGLLRHELARTESELVPELHRRASAWFRAAGSVSEAIRHATLAGDASKASELITLHWYDYLQRGRIETVAGWLDALGDEAVAGDAGLCLTKAWIAVNTGHLDRVAQWIEAADRASSGDGTAVVESGVAALREIYRYMDGNVDEAVEAGRRSVERGETPWRPVGCPVLGIALFWSGRSREAAEELEESVATARAAGNHLAVIHASGGLAAIRAERGDLGVAGEVAGDALELAEHRSLDDHWATTLARVVRGRALEQDGRLAEAGDVIEHSVELSRRGVAAVEIGYALLSHAEARQLQGDPDGAGQVLREARRTIDRCPEPGILKEMLARTERRLQRGLRRRAGAGTAGELTDRELAVIRLLPSELSQREIADALYVSLNTIKTHTKSIYRKLDVEGRGEAVDRAHELGVI